MQNRRLAVAIPLVAVAIVGVLLYASYAPYQVALHLQTRLAIEIVNTQLKSQFVILRPDIGAPGGIISTTRYLSDGVNGFYPLHTTDTTGWVYVDSRVARQYVLGDFFEVWGEPLGVNNTLGYKANYTNGNPNFSWTMCIHPPAGSEIPSFDWGSHVLKDGEVLHLLYSQIGCA